MVAARQAVNMTGMAHRCWSLQLSEIPKKQIVLRNLNVLLKKW